MSPDFKPLAGCRVLDLSMLLPGPYCTWQLASFGAEVIKIEPPAGDPVRHMNPDMFGLINCGKASVVLDLKQAGDRDAFLQMVASADMVVEGFRPGVLDRLGLPVARLLALQPKLVVGSISGFGWTGPYRDLPGHDISFLALSGYFSVPAQMQHQITRPQVRLADLAAGQSAALALTMAWIQAQQTGKGCHVDAAILDAAMGWTAPMMLSTRPHQDTASSAHIMADSALYRTADDRHLCIATLEDKFWLNFTAAVHDLAPELSDTRWLTRQGRDAHKQALALALEHAIATQALAVWVARVHGVDTAVAPVYTGREALHDPHVQARGFFGVPTTDEPPPAMRFPALFDGQHLAKPAAAPTLGQHSATQFFSRHH